MPDERSIADQLVDLLIYAPVGFLLSARTVVPQLVERGRSEVEAPVSTLRLLAQVAARQGRTELQRLCDDIRTQPVEGDAQSPAAPPTPALPIDDYDSRTAVQIVALLDGLAPDELRAIRAHEAAHRGRRTVLARIDQRLAG